MNKPLLFSPLSLRGRHFCPAGQQHTDRYGYQVPFSRTIREHAGILSMAVGLIVHPDQAEQILQDGGADLIALAREMIYNPNWALDAARKMGVGAQSALVPPAGGWWLQKRAAAMPDLVTSTGHCAGRHQEPIAGRYEASEVL